ncbi:MAG: FG-GAP-like repeat-containing protein [Puniceicoccales bacterium]|jgi:hypothetical protein|nr:FG-GAP-like repeat-containing protein [Puniceicoccales bacterium]
MLLRYLKPVGNITLFAGIASLGLASSPIQAMEDFSQLKSHWNFDEARDWHNMPFPFAQSVSRALDSVGNNDLILGPQLDPVTAWVSGRQYSGIKLAGPNDLLEFSRPVPELQKTASLSYWIKADRGQETEEDSAIKNSMGMTWGKLSSTGNWVVTQGSDIVASTTKPVNDGLWHHIVITRNDANGAVQIFLDGELNAQGKGRTGEVNEKYAGLGTGTCKGALDQVHLFANIINVDTVKALYSNHAPKAYETTTLITRGRPSVTASILHGYTFDPDQDTISVSRFGQGENGTVKYNGDGTFTYTAKAGFSGTDRFPVTITDGKGGFCTTYMVVKDETTMPRMPVIKYTDFQELEPIGEKNGQRIPQVFDWDGNGRPDLLVCDNQRIWLYRNTQVAGKTFFDKPVEIKDSSGNPISASSIALLAGTKNERPSLITRTRDGTLQVYQSKPRKDGTDFVSVGKILNQNDGDFTCAATAFAFGDYDNDGLPDLLIGSGSGGIYFHKNVGTLGKPRFQAEPQRIVDGSYNLFPYFADLNGDGKIDLLHGINWGSIHYWINAGKKSIQDEAATCELLLTDAQGREPRVGDNSLLRHMDGTFGAFGDFNGDGILDVALGSHARGILGVAYGVDVNSPKKNLQLIEEIYRAHPNNLGQALEANDQELLKKYRILSREWIAWAVSQPTVEGRKQAYEDLKAHVRKFPFLQRKPLDAWVKRDKNKIVDIGPMHHVPGIFVMNWVTLQNLLPDSAQHRQDVANTLGLRGLDREQYLRSGLAVADNNKCSDGQILAITDFMTYHPRVLFPDDHISIDQNMGDGREAMAYVFESNKNTFGTEVGNAACESARDLREAAEKHLGPGSATGDYFTLVMGHEVCHSLDAYVRRRANQDLARRWADMIIYAANNGGTNEIIGQDDTGWIDMNKTQQLFRTKQLWDGKTSWDTAWNEYWNNCPYKNLTFMRGNIGWFLGAKQETLATQANHHWAGSEARLVGAIDRYNRGYKANINEVVLFLDFLSGGLNKMPMYNFTTSKNPNRVQFHVDHAWLERNDQGYITKITIGPRVYDFEVSSTGRVTGIKAQPFKGLTPGGKP